MTCRRLRLINTENAWPHSLDRVIAHLYAHGGGTSEAETEPNAGTIVLPNDREVRGIPTSCGVNALAETEADSELRMKPPSWYWNPSSEDSSRAA